MRALELQDVGFDRLRWVEREVVRPRGDQVLLKMKAAAIGLRDYKLVSGAYAQAEQKRPLVPGGEGVGEVVEIGPDVTALRVGERVNPIFVQGWLDASRTREFSRRRRSAVRCSTARSRISGRAASAASSRCRST